MPAIRILYYSFAGLAISFWGKTQKLGLEESPGSFRKKSLRKEGCLGIIFATKHYQKDYIMKKEEKWKIICLKGNAS